MHHAWEGSTSQNTSKPYRYQTKKTHSNWYGQRHHGLWPQVSFCFAILGLYGSGVKYSQYSHVAKCIMGRQCCIFHGCIMHHVSCIFVMHLWFLCKMHRLFDYSAWYMTQHASCLLHRALGMMRDRFHAKRLMQGGWLRKQVTSIGALWNSVSNHRFFITWCLRRAYTSLPWSR